MVSVMDYVNKNVALANNVIMLLLSTIAVTNENCVNVVMLLQSLMALSFCICLHGILYVFQSCETFLLIRVKSVCVFYCYPTVL